MKFTTRSIEALRTKAERYEKWEDNGKGFGIRVSIAGKKSWIYLYRYNGTPRRMTLGEFPKMGLAEAHEAHATARKQLDKGIDPGLVKQQQEADYRDADSVAELAHQYIEKYAKPRKRSWQNDERMLELDVLSAWGKRKARDITRRDIIGLLDKIVDRGSPIGANRTLDVIRAMFKFGVGRDIVPASPCVDIQRPGKAVKRDRVLTEKEIRDYWLALDKAGITKPTRLAPKLQLLTAQRKGEVVRAEWSEFDLPAAWWTIPASRAKNGLVHRVPLSPEALAIIAELMEGNNTKWLFPSKDGKSHMHITTVNAALDRSDALNGFDFTLHDLRRSAATYITGLGFPRLVVSKILNHTEGGATAVYDRHAYDNEKRTALEAWGRRLMDIIAKRESTVTPIRSKHQAA